MSVCEHCSKRFCWECEDDGWRKGGCEEFRLDFDTLSNKQKKAIHRILAREEADRDEY